MVGLGKGSVAGAGRIAYMALVIALPGALGACSTVAGWFHSPSDGRAAAALPDVRRPGSFLETVPPAVAVERDRSSESVAPAVGAHRPAAGTVSIVTPAGTSGAVKTEMGRKAASVPRPVSGARAASVSPPVSDPRSVSEAQPVSRVQPVSGVQSVSQTMPVSDVQPVSGTRRMSNTHAAAGAIYGSDDYSLVFTQMYRCLAQYDAGQRGASHISRD
jgi:hypothetical protein